MKLRKLRNCCRWVVLFFIDRLLCLFRLTNLFLRSWCGRDFLNWVCILLAFVIIFSVFQVFRLYEDFWVFSYVTFTSVAVNHLDYLGVQVAWVTGPWFLSIFMNMLPWESGQVLCCILLILKLICVEMHLKFLSAYSLILSYLTNLCILILIIGFGPIG